MGRTKRKRLRRCPVSTVVCDQSIIELQKWMLKNGWENSRKLALKSFPNTGRGLSSKHATRPNDILITVPYELMITFATFKLQLSEILSPGAKLTMHELLSLFLVYERSKGDMSPWRYYINSLPVDIPNLSWHTLPDELQSAGRIMAEQFEKSFRKVRESVRPVFDQSVLGVFKWAYMMVNTRAVYVDPHIVGGGEYLLDKPSLALCPFLDMFNHHYVANTEAALKNENGKMVYQLKTLTAFKKHHQIFISYGAHSNTKLLLEYGFFIPNNIHDVVEFSFEEVLTILDIDLSRAKYKYVCDNLFDNDLYISLDGFSFNLKAVLFVGLFGDCRNVNSIIYSDNYPEKFMKNLSKLLIILLDYKKNIFQKDYEAFSCSSSCSLKGGNFELIQQFSLYRKNFLSDIKEKFAYE